MVKPISERKCATIAHKKADLRIAKFRLFLCGFFVSFFAKKGRFSGLNLCRFAKRNRHAFDFDFRGIKGGAKRPLFKREWAYFCEAKCMSFRQLAVSKNKCWVKRDRKGSVYTYIYSLKI